MLQPILTELVAFVAGYRGLCCLSRDWDDYYCHDYYYWYYWKTPMVNVTLSLMMKKRIRNAADWYDILAYCHERTFSLFQMVSEMQTVFEYFGARLGRDLVKKQG